MKINATIKYQGAEIALKDRLVAEIIKLANKYEAEAKVSQYQEDGQCDNCGEITALVFPETIFRNGNTEEILLCPQCEDKYSRRQSTEESALFDDFKGGRG